MRSFILILFLLPMLADAQTSEVPTRQTILSDWEFRQAQQGDWRPTPVPASVHTALLRNGMIEDPYYRDNELQQQWIENTDWEFQCAFDVDPGLFQRRHIEMIFKGLDTYAQVYLNDTLILTADNMFRTWRVDVKKWLLPKNNRLHVYFESPVKKVEGAWKEQGYELPGGIRTMTRKAQFHFGWDWGPRLAGCGILQKPELVGWDDLLLENVFATTISISQEMARVVLRFRYRSDFSGPVTLTARDGKRKSVEERAFSAGVHEDSIWFDVPDPKFWWCRDMGDPHLYDFGLEIKRGIRLLEKSNVRMGIRTVELVTEKDKDGETFYFKLNGRPVFCRGANYIPQDMFQDRVTPDHYRRLMDDVVEANMNMLRVWGGGIYEDDLFYQLCDARGILVWQDFMYACALYPGSSAFLKTASQEAYEQIERLRQHPSIALWCGNNENNEGWHHWGWQMQFTEAQRKQVWRNYQLLFNDLLPAYVANYGGGVPYWESSPKFGRGNPKSTKEGDSHYWGVWHDEEPFDVLNRKVPRFMSEFGFQSFPEWRTIESFTLPEDRELQTKVMLTHQKHPRGNALIAEYLKRDFRQPKNFQDFVYVSQLLQAEGMRIGIEAHRRNKPYCMGTLYWQLNDVWPVASWSSIDYYGRWKAMHYYVREAYRPVAVLPYLTDDILDVYAVSDLEGVQKANLQVRGLDFSGNVLSNVELTDLGLRPDSARVVWRGTLRNVLKGANRENALVDISLKSPDGALLSRRLFYLAPPRKLSLPGVRVSMQAEQVNDGYQLTLQCNKLAKNVLIGTDADGFFDDNYFDLLPGEKKVVLFKTSQILDDPASAFRVRSLVDTY